MKLEDATDTRNGTSTTNVRSVFFIRTPPVRRRSRRGLVGWRLWHCIRRRESAWEWSHVLCPLIRRHCPCMEGFTP